MFVNAFGRLPTSLAGPQSLLGRALERGLLLWPLPHAWLRNGESPQPKPFVTGPCVDGEARPVWTLHGIWGLTSVAGEPRLC